MSQEDYVKNPFREGKLSSKPRSFTEYELDKIVDNLHEPRALGRETRILSLIQIKAHVKSELRNKVICPEYIEFVTDAILKKYDLAQMNPGMNMISITEAMMQPLMQAVLNTFHKAGLLTQTGYTAMKDAFFLPPKRNEEVIIVNFNRKMTRDEIFNLRSDFVHRSIGHLIINEEIDEYDNLKHYPWEEFQKKIYNVKIFEDFVLLRITLDVKMMVEHKIKMIDVVKIIRKRSHNVTVISSPLEYGIIDIYAQEDVLNLEIKNLSQGGNILNNTNLRRYYFNCILPEIKQITISGIPEIHALYPRKIVISSAFLSCTKLSSMEKKVLPRELYLNENDKKSLEDLNLWILYKNKNKTMFEGISDQMIKEFFNVIGVKTIEFKSYNFTVLMPSKVDPNISPLKYLESFLSPGSTPNKKKEKLEDLSKHHYCVLTGNNIEEVYKLSYVDRRRTFSNNFHTISGTLGIEAARKYHFYNLQFILDSTGKSINPLYIEAFSDIVTHKGSPLGMTHNGIAKRVSGFFSHITFHHVKDVLINNSIHNIGGESVDATSVSLALGMKTRGGTGNPYHDSTREKSELGGYLYGDNEEIDNLFADFTGSTKELDVLVKTNPEIELLYRGKFNPSFEPNKIKRAEIMKPELFEEQESIFTEKRASEIKIITIGTGTTDFVKDLISQNQKEGKEYMGRSEEQKKIVKEFNQIPEAKFDSDRSDSE